MAGVSTYVGRRKKIPHFRVRYENGDEEELPLSEVAALLPTQPANSQPSRKSARTAKTATVPSFANLTAALATSSAGDPVQPLPITPEDVSPLFSSLWWDTTGAMYLPYGRADAALSGLAHHTLYPPPSASSYYPLEERMYDEALYDYPPPNIFAGSPTCPDTFRILAQRYALSLAAARVPAGYLTCAPEHRVRWLCNLSEVGRLFVLPCASGFWVLIFATRERRTRMLRVPVQYSWWPSS